MCLRVLPSECRQAKQPRIKLLQGWDCYCRLWSTAARPRNGLNTVWIRYPDHLHSRCQSSLDTIRRIFKHQNLHQYQTETSSSLPTVWFHYFVRGNLLEKFILLQKPLFSVSFSQFSFHLQRCSSAFKLLHIYALYKHTTCLLTHFQWRLLSETLKTLRVWLSALISW